MNPTLSKLKAKRKKLSRGDNYFDIARILNLPIKIPMLEGSEGLEAWNRENVLASAFNNGFRLWPVQAHAIQEYREIGGAFLPIGVGFGKTLVAQSVARVGAMERGHKKVMLLAPSSTVAGVVNDMFPLAATRIPLGYHLHVLSGRSKSDRLALAKSNRPGVYLFTYELLRRPGAEEVLNYIEPTLIICDEAHALGNEDAAQTKRLFRYIAEVDPEGVAMSGTITGTSIKDYYHIIRWCLKDGCPLPLEKSLVHEWSKRLDSDSDESVTPRSILPVVKWAKEHFSHEEIEEDTAGFRNAYRLRLTTAPGVAVTGDAEIQNELILHNYEIPFEGEGIEKLKGHIKDLEEKWRTPNGDEIEHQIHAYKWHYEFSSGCYNELVFPDPEEMLDHSHLLPGQLEEAEIFMEAARIRHDHDQEYARALRYWIQDYSRAGLDTPQLIGQDMRNNKARNVGEQLYGLWTTLKEETELLKELALEIGAYRGDPKDTNFNRRIRESWRTSRFVRVSPFKINFAVEWAQAIKEDGIAHDADSIGAIIWVKHIGMGMWLTEALQAADVDCMYCPSGDNVQILDPAHRDRIIVAPMGSHGEGKNLQHFFQQLFLQWPRNAKRAEQVLGRMHRNGQDSPEVWAHTLVATEFDRLCMAATLNDALYIHQTMGTRQKLIYGTYSPKLPAIFPPEVLRERGFQNKPLTGNQLEFMEKRFGNLNA